VHSLQQPFRSAQDLEYTAFVDHIGEDYENKDIYLDMLDPVKSVPETLNFLFPPCVLQNPKECLSRAFLSPLNWTVDEFNKEMLGRLPGNECMQPFCLFRVQVN